MLLFPKIIIMSSKNLSKTSKISFVGYIAEKCQKYNYKQYGFLNTKDIANQMIIRI